MNSGTTLAQLFFPLVSLELAVLYVHGTMLYNAYDETWGKDDWEDSQHGRTNELSLQFPGVDSVVICCVVDNKWRNVVFLHLLNAIHTSHVFKLIFPLLYDSKNSMTNPKKLDQVLKTRISHKTIESGQPRFHNCFRYDKLIMQFW